jgi:hypothetical protein
MGVCCLLVGRGAGGAFSLRPHLALVRAFASEGKALLFHTKKYLGKGVKSWRVIAKTPAIIYIITV